MIYNYLKLLHFIAVILFLGNIFLSFYWMHKAIKTKNLKIIIFTVHGIIISDKIFTIPAVVIITASGIIAAVHAQIPMLSTGWVFWSIILFSISGIVFGWKVSPLQKKIYLRLNIDNSANFDWTNFNKMYVEWKIWGLIAFLTPIIVLALMTLKIPH